MDTLDTMGIGKGLELFPEQIEDIGEIDVLLVPVGGNCTIDAEAATAGEQRRAGLRAHQGVVLGRAGGGL